MGISTGIAAVASIASIGLSAYGSVTKAQGTKAADEMQADKATRAAEFGRLQADLTDTTMRERLNTTLSNIDAIRAAGNVDPSSPTTAAIEDRDIVLSNRQRTAAVLSERSQTAEDIASANYLRKAGGFALMQGYIGAGAAAAGGIAQATGPQGALGFSSGKKAA
jgi:hypothetical protein